MRLVNLSDGPDFDPTTFVAAELVRLEHASVRVIRLASGQALPKHRHGTSDLVLVVIEGAATFNQSEEASGVGTLAVLTGDEELDVANRGDAPLTLLAVLAPAFP